MTEVARKLVLASRNGKLKECEDLIAQHPEIDYAEPPLRRTALFMGSMRGHLAVCRLLLDKGASVNARDAEGRAPLHVAAFFGHANLVAFLIERGALIDVPDLEGHTPLMRAVLGSKYEVVNLLLEKGAQSGLVSSENETTCFHLAGFMGEVDLALQLSRRGAWWNRFSLSERQEVQNALALLCLPSYPVDKTAR